MDLPKEIHDCISRLEEAGFAAYAVGGCVRDSLLGLTPHDYDLCTAATPGQISAVFSDCPQLHVGEKHGTVTLCLPGGNVEITTFRTEGGYRDHRHPDYVVFVPDIESDLSRRDFTVNAMAYSPIRGLADPFGGGEDLRQKLLRAVGEPDLRFQEDALRILRGVRFALRYQLQVEDRTWQSMVRQSPLLKGIAAERVFSELCQLLPLASAQQLMFFAPVLGTIIPELQPTFGFDQHSPHHAYDLFTHIAQVTAVVPPTLSLRLAALLHDIGKIPTFTQDETGRGHFYGHAEASAQMADAILLRLKAPTALREQVVTLIRLHMTPLLPDRKLLRRRLSQYGFETVRQLLLLQQADFTSKGVLGDAPDFGETAKLLSRLEEENTCLTLRDLAVKGGDLIAIGFVPGKALGDCLSALLRQVLDDQLPNQKGALLQAAKRLHDKEDLP